jgi:phosphopantothenoylcysteine decarboxylase/phosphopantothenate--cysteine ligase
MTAAAQQFITPVTFQALSGRPVRTEMFYRVGTDSPDHLATTEHADLLIVAPATADILAKTACGLCDDLVSTLLCAAPCPVLFAPAMNHRMWLNPICQENVAKLQRHGYRFIGPEEGRMAEGTCGPGRMSEPAAILREAITLLTPTK